MAIRFFAIAGCFFAAVFQLHSQGYIVPNGITIKPGGTTGAGSEIDVQGPTSHSGFNMEPLFGLPPNTFNFASFADEGVRAFFVNYNDPVSLQSIQTQNYTDLGSSGNPWTFKNGTPFYVGLYTGSNPWIYTDHGAIYTGIYQDPVFGWAELENKNGIIQMLGSGLEYGGGGIFAGTQNIIAIPEPSSCALFGAGFLFVALRRKRNG